MKTASAFVFAAMMVFPLLLVAEDITLIKRAKRVEHLESTHHTIQKGDTLSKIFLEDFGAKAEDMPYLYKEFRGLNPKIKNLNRIYAGQKIVIPHMPEQGREMAVKAASPDVFVMKQGQHLAMVLREVYGLPDSLIFNEYLNLISELNPEIEDLDHVEPGQRIKMPRMDEVISAVRVKNPKITVRTQERQEPGKIDQEIESPGGGEIAAVRHEPPEDTPEIEEIVVLTSPKKKQDPEPAEYREARVALAVQKRPAEAKTSKMEPEVPRPAPEVARQDEPRPMAGSGEDGNRQRAARLVRNTLMPALTQMGGRKKDQGTYFMPMEGGSSISIDTSEIPVMELDTGQRIILDVNNKISPEVKALLEKTFPNCKVVSGPVQDLEEVMDTVLSVSGYFSINKDAGPLLVGEEEKVRFFGKWIVYKDFSRHNVFVVNILSGDDNRTPATIRDYASRFGIDLIEMGGKENGSALSREDLVRKMGHSYRRLFDELGIAYDTEKVLDLISLDSLKIAYKAPFLVNRVILTEDLPDKTMADLLKQKGYRVIGSTATPLREVLDAVGIAPEGPPVRIVIAQGRSELELPALKIGDSIVLERSIDRDIANYLVTRGMNILAW